MLFLSFYAVFKCLLRNIIVEMPLGPFSQIRAQFSTDGHFVQWNRVVCANLRADIMRDNSEIILDLDEWLILFDLIQYVPVNTFSVMSGRVLLG